MIQIFKWRENSYGSKLSVKDLAGIERISAWGSPRRSATWEPIFRETRDLRAVFLQNSYRFLITQQPHRLGINFFFPDGPTAVLC